MVRISSDIAHYPGGGVRCLSVCFSVILLNVKDREREIAVKPLEPVNDFNTVGYGKVCSCAPEFNFTFTPLGGAITER